VQSTTFRGPGEAAASSSPVVVALEPGRQSQDIIMRASGCIVLGIPGASSIVVAQLGVAGTLLIEPRVD
jgi:hypothetical protein